MTNFICDVCGIEFTDFSPENVGALLDEDRHFIKFKFTCFSCLEKEENKVM